MARYRVTAQAFSRKNMNRLGKSRTEIINTKTNLLFKGATTKQAIRKKYENFWNKMNLGSPEVVVVSKVTKTK